jgi:hypothetical protein
MNVESLAYDPCIWGGEGVVVVVAPDHGLGAHPSAGHQRASLNPVNPDYPGVRVDGMGSKGMGVNQGVRGILAGFSLPASQLPGAGTVAPC